VRHRFSIMSRAHVAAGLAIVLALTATGCASVFGRRPEDRTVTVSLPMSRPAAVRRTLAAMREQGYRIRESLTSGGELVTEPFRHTNKVEAVFRAVITESGRTSRVVLSGSYHERQFGGIARGKEREITRSDEGLPGELWARLQNLALAIRTPP